MNGVGIEIQKLVVGYGTTTVLHEIDLSVKPSEFIALLGSSGCGKTTLLRSLAGFVKPMSGQILVEGRDISDLSPDKREMAMVFQSYALWPHMSVRQNIGYGLRLRRRPADEITKKVNELMVMLGLNEFADRKVPQLSGGQRQRVALGRALAVETPILLLDEPLSNLDARNRLAMRHEIRALQQKLGLTAVHVTHDREEAMVMADRMVILDKGKIAQEGSPHEVYERPVSDFVASFMGAENSIEIEVSRTENTVTIGETSKTLRAFLPISNEIGDGGLNWQAGTSEKVLLRFRSDAAHLTTIEQIPDKHLGIQGKVTQASYPGGVYRYEIKCEGGSFIIDDSSRYSVGDVVNVCLPAEGLHLFSLDNNPNG